MPPMAVPDENIKTPLVPVVPAFAERRVIPPLDDAVPSPEAMESRPPVLIVLRPAATNSMPPWPLVPLPTVTETKPPRPCVAAAEPNLRAPELPLEVEPDEKLKTPLMPAVPAFADRIVTPPLDDAMPSPDASESKPPVVMVLPPAVAKMWPP